MTRHLFSAVAAVLFLVVCASADELPPLHTGVDGTFAPHAFPNLSGGGYQGFNIDLANEFARRLKRNITIDAAQYSGPASSDAGRYLRLHCCSDDRNRTAPRTCCSPKAISTPTSSS